MVAVIVLVWTQKKAENPMELARPKYFSTMFRSNNRQTQAFSFKLSALSFTKRVMVAVIVLVLTQKRQAKSNGIFPPQIFYNDVQI